MSPDPPTLEELLTGILDELVTLGLVPAMFRSVAHAEVIKAARKDPDKVRAALKAIYLRLEPWWYTP